MVFLGKIFNKVLIMSSCILGTKFGCCFIFNKLVSYFLIALCCIYMLVLLVHRGMCLVGLEKFAA